MTPTLRQLEYAVAVADHLHFRRAAETCHVSQPALSAQIAQLERTLGVVLFERSRRGVLVTAEGVELVARARCCLDAVRDLAEAADRLGRPGPGRLRIGVIPTIAPYVLPELIERWRRRQPDARVELREALTETLLGHLRAGESDLLLLALPVAGEDLVRRELLREPFVLLAPAGHRALSARSLVLADLRGEDLLLLDEGHCLRDQALEICEPVGARAVTQIRAGSLATLVQMVASGLGITLLPASAIEKETRGLDTIRWRAFDAPVPSRRVGWVWRQHSAREAVFEAFHTECAGAFTGSWPGEIIRPA